ncbi:MAG: SdrD B-like domain-containing protein [Caldilineaceae bacterium]
MQQSPQCAPPDVRSLRLNCPEAAPWAKAAAKAKPPSWLKACFVVLLLLAAYIQTNTVAYAQGANCTSNDIGGVVFRDYNANGVRDAREPGLSGIGVTAYNSSNQLVLSVTTTISGSYVLPGVAAPVRLEFTGLPSYVQEGAFGKDSGTSVQFVNAATCAANFGVNNPAQYCQTGDKLYLATSCYVRAGATSPISNVLYSFQYMAGAVDNGSNLPPAFATPAPNNLAHESQIGATWGQAWRSSTKTLYLAAFMKRHTRFGPGGPAAIYQVGLNPQNGLTTNTPSLLVNLDTVFPASAPVAGDDVHDPNDTAHDPKAFDAVGKYSLGDLDISDDGNTLFVVNLYDKRIYAIPIADPTQTRRFTAPVLAPADCAAADVRPFALKVNDGRAYVGITCSGESTPGDLSKIGLFVYSFATNAVPTGTGDVAAPTYSEALRFIGAGTTGMGYLRFNNKTWKTWTSDFNAILTASSNNSKQMRYPMPMLTDLEFDNGDMILGVRDRLGDMIGRMAYSPNIADNTLYDGRSTGDILRACYTGSNWLMESNSQSAPGCITHFGPTAGAYATNPPKPNFREGPGGGEFFHDDDQNKVYPWDQHPEHTVGGLAQVPGFNDVVVDGYDPIAGVANANLGGIDWLNNSTGSSSREYVIFDTKVPGTFGKTNGLGDLEALCDPAPLEIGNRVWNDTNGNGIQDAGETGIDNVTVELYRNGVLVGTTTTANGGQYYFNNANVTLNGAFGIVPGTGAAGGASEYEVRIPNATGASQQASLAGLNLTQALADPSAAGFLRDDNGILNGVNATYAIPYVDLAAVGDNNHSYDFGFTAAAPPAFIDLEIVKTVTPGVYTLGTNTNVTFVFTVTNHGPQDVTNANVADSQPANVTFNSWTCAIGAPGAGSVTNACGAANGSGDIATTVTLNNGATAIFTINATITSAATGTIINTASESLPPGSTQNPNQNLPDQSSAQVTPGVPPLSLGNQVWNDANNNGLIDPGEVGIPNVTVNLYLDSNQDGVPDGPAIATQQTNSGGYYLFTNLAPNGYIVEVIPPAGYTSSTGNNSEPAPSPNTNLTDGDDNCTMINGVARTGSVTLTIGGAPLNEQATPGIPDTAADNNANYTVDCGFFLPTTPGLASLGDFVWQDTNKNGVQDTGEAPVAGVTVTLFSGTGTQLAVTTTDASGLYHFTNLQPGDYSVCFTLPTGQQFTQANQGSNDALDSDADPTTGCTPKITLTAGQNDLTWDAGITPIPAALGGCTWDDGVTNQSDGIRQPTEKLLTGVTVILRDQNGNEIGRTTTDANGCYLFDNLTPGNYVVSFVLPQGYSNFTITQSGTNGSDPNPITGQTVTIKLPAGTRDLTWDAGFVRAPTGLPPGDEPQAANRIFLPLVNQVQ